MSSHQYVLWFLLEECKFLGRRNLKTNVVILLPQSDDARRVKHGHGEPAHSCAAVNAWHEEALARARHSGLEESPGAQVVSWSHHVSSSWFVNGSSLNPVFSTEFKPYSRLQDPAALKDRRMENLVAYARKVEGDMYESANSRVKRTNFLAMPQPSFLWL